jgi:alanine racemase
MLFHSEENQSLLYSIEEVNAAIGGKSFICFPEKKIEFLLTDSRKLTDPAGSLFFAIEGTRHNGHDYIKELLKQGVRNFIVSQQECISPEANFILVDHVLTALQQLAAYHRRKFSFPVIGITGSNGKTIIKEWLYLLLRDDFAIVRSPRSFNSQTGVPLSVWQFNPQHTLGIMEAGISKPGEMERLQKIILPDTGIFSNIGTAHDENFESKIQKTDEKLKLFSASRFLIYCRDHQLIHDRIKQSGIISPSTQLFTWSARMKADLQIGRILRKDHTTSIKGVFRNSFIEIIIPFTDDASVENSIQCWAYMLMNGYDNQVIAERMLLLSPVAMRLELKDGINHCSVINDTYNSDFGSLQVALDFLEQQKMFRKKTVILSDILQSGQNSRQLYSDVAALLHQKNINRLIGIGPEIASQAGVFQLEKIFFADTAAFMAAFHSMHFENEAILVKGARPFGFEKISKLLQQKAHTTILEVNLNAIENNLNVYKSRLLPGTKVMCMLKAFGYGSGIHELAGLLQFHKVDYFAVAYADEGVALRNAGITVPIMVMNPEEQSFELMIRNRLEPEIYNFRLLALFVEEVKKHESIQPYPIHLEFDTGMKRLGFDISDLRQLMVRLKNYKQVQVVSVFSHLAASDEPEHDAFTRNQIETFARLSAELQEFTGKKIIRHILNSAGIIRFPEAQFEMVRLGIGLHGIAATDEERKFLQAAASLKTTISQIRNVKKGDSIGYSRKSIAPKEIVMAVTGIGYADGFPRSLSNGRGMMMVKGKLTPVIGNVCMDMTMLDITGVDAAEGDEVIVFGNGLPIEHLANAAGTIPYEILTGISQRVKRVYYQE